MKHKLFIFLLCSSFASLQAQTSKNEVINNIFLASSNYYAYPVPTKKLTPPPVGYKPFYISHYGRHGSRYMIYLLKSYSCLRLAFSLLNSVVIKDP